MIPCFQSHHSESDSPGSCWYGLMTQVELLPDVAAQTPVPAKKPTRPLGTNAVTSGVKAATPAPQRRATAAVASNVRAPYPRGGHSGHVGTVTVPGAGEVVGSGLPKTCV